VSVSTRVTLQWWVRCTKSWRNRVLWPAAPTTLAAACSTSIGVIPSPIVYMARTGTWSWLLKMMLRLR
jgi:hypothetical protein